MTTIESVTDAPPEVQAVQQLFQIATGYMASAALQTALKLQIPDRVAAGTTGRERARARRGCRRGCAVPGHARARQPRRV
jgi:hypothetical protein